MTPKHPRFITEIAELLLAEEKVKIERGQCIVDKMNNLQIPNTIRAVLVAKMDQLSSAEQITLKVASVIGPIFQLDLVCDVSLERARCNSDYKRN